MQSSKNAQETLRIAHILPALKTGGVESAVFDLVCYLKDQGHFPLVIAQQGPWSKKFIKSGIHCVSLPVHRKEPFSIIKHGFMLAQLAKVHKIQLLHVHSRAPAWSTRIAAAWAGLPWLSTFHGRYSHRSFFKKLYNQVMVQGDAVIAPSTFIARHIAEVYGIDQNFIRIIPQGINTGIFDPEYVPQEAIQDFKQRYNLHHKKIILLPARYTRLKGHIWALETFERLPEDMVLCCVGPYDAESQYFQTINQQRQRKNLKEKVIFLPPLDEMAVAYAACDLVLSASIVPEAFGRTMAEAQAMGRCVIATDHGGAQDIIDPGETGWLCPVGDKDALTHLIQTFFTFTTAQRQYFERQAYIRARTYFSCQEMGEQTVKLYREILCPRRS